MLDSIHRGKLDLLVAIDIATDHLKKLYGFSQNTTENHEIYMDPIKSPSGDDGSSSYIPRYRLQMVVQTS